MSWRLIIAFLLLAAGFSAWGGLQLGDWLIAHGPTQIQMPAHHPELDSSASLDAQGRPFVATAPQLLPNGRQGVPSMMPPVDWSIETTSLMEQAGPIALATTTITLDQAIEQAALRQMGGTPADPLAGIGVPGGGHFVQPIDVTEPSMSPDGPPVGRTGQVGGGSWQAEFRAELKACENVGFFSRPSCAWAVRNQYCEPNAAWGKVEGCPARKSDF
ncbi:hypothetical protein [Castellaniella sp.]|uniref:hypothetical protein n=1 Tax=Castellaniella sp. TaxID=1955812 RepID=UPI00355FE815